MNEIMTYKTVVEDETIEFEIIKPNYLDDYSGEQLAIFEEDGKLFDLIEEDIDKQIKELNGKIDNLTNHSDGMDYAMAICSGLVAGIVDIVFVGEFDFEGAKKSVDETFEKFVHEKAKDIKTKDALDKAEKKFAQRGEKLSKEKIEEIKAGIAKDFDENPSLSKSIKTLEEKYKIPTDSLWEKKGAKINSVTHHLDDLAHHPSPLGLFASILTQFTKKGYFQNKYGINFIFDVETKSLIGGDLKSKLYCGVINWFGHLISDMAGTASSAAKGKLGMGLPGPFVTTIKELGLIPLFKKMGLPELANHLFTDKDALFDEFRMDLRSELALAKELSKQAIPVFVDEILVRCCYFVRRLVEKAKVASSIKDIPWKEVLPFGNRTIARMVTISLGTMEVVDITDAAIRGAIAAGKGSAAGAAAGSVGGPYGAAGGAAVSGTVMFWKTFALRVNYVGVGSLAVAGFVDFGMGMKRQKLISERIAMYDKKIAIGNARVYYKEAEMWISAEKAGKSVEEAYRMIEVAEKELSNSIEKTKESLDSIDEYLDSAEEKNPGLKDSMLNALKWGI